MTRPDISRVLLGQESTVENVIGSFKPQQLAPNKKDITKLVQWENGPLLKAATTGTPVILNRIDEAKAHVTERINPILERNARLDEKNGRRTVFLVPEKGEDIEQPMKAGFVVVATLTLDPSRRDLAISLALRNRFVTNAVESPKIDVDLKKRIAVMTIERFSRRLQDISWGRVLAPTSMNPRQRNALSEAISGNLPETTTIRDIALLSDAAASIHGIVTFPDKTIHVRACQLNGASLASKAAEFLVQQTIQEPMHIQAGKGDSRPRKAQTTERQRFFYRGDTSAPMWQSMAALAVCSATGWPLFLQGASGCGKTEAVRHYSSYRKFGVQTLVYSVSCSVETPIEQFLGSQVFEKNGFRFVEGP
jgi:hypothetical protein